MSDTFNLLKVEANNRATRLGHSLSLYKVIPFAPKAFTSVRDYYLSRCRTCDLEAVLEPKNNRLGGKALTNRCAVSAQYHAK